MLLRVEAGLDKYREYDEDENLLPMAPGVLQRIAREEVTAETGTVDDLSPNYNIIFVMDALLAILLFLLSYSRNQMEKATGEFQRRGLHLPEAKHRESMRQNTLNFARNYIKSYENCILRIALLLLQPYLFLNVALEHSFNFEEDVGYQTLAAFRRLERVSDFQFFRYYGIVNDFLAFVFLIIRCLFLIEFSLLYIFDDHVRLTRIFQLMGVRFEFFNMCKYIYKRYPVKWTFFMLFVCLLLLIITLIEYELKIMNLPSIAVAVYYCIITMTTVGYGEYSSQSKIGWLCTILTVMMGVTFECLFLVAWANFITLDEGEKKAKILLLRCDYKEQLKEKVVDRLIYSWRIRQLKREFQQYLPASSQRNGRNYKEISQEPDDEASQQRKRVDEFVPGRLKRQLFEFEKRLLQAENEYKETKVDYDFILKKDEFRKNRFCDSFKVIAQDKNKIRMDQKKQNQEIVQLSEMMFTQFKELDMLNETIEFVGQIDEEAAWYQSMCRL